MDDHFRFGTNKAIGEIAALLNLPNEPNMQDWSYEVSNPNDMEKYLALYGKTTDEDQKFVLVEMILQALVEQPNEEKLMAYWRKISSILVVDQKIHEFTIDYWIRFGQDDSGNHAALSALLSKLHFL